MDTHLNITPEIRVTKAGTSIPIPTKAYYSNRRKNFAESFDQWQIYGIIFDVESAQKRLEEIYEKVEKIPRKNWEDGFNSALLNWWTKMERHPKRSGLKKDKFSLSFGGVKTGDSKHWEPEEIFSADEVRFHCEPHLPSHEYFEADGPDIEAILEYLLE